MDQKKVNRMIGKHDLRNLVKDSDGDGVSNVLDCKPHNPRQQGLVHKAGAFVARKFGAEKTAERIERREAAVESAKEEAREERAKQLKQTAVFREQQRGERQRTFIKRGGAFGAVRRSFAQVAPRPRPLPVVKRVKKRKLPKVTRRRVKRKAVVRQTLPTPKKEKHPLSKMMGL